MRTLHDPLVCQPRAKTLRLVDMSHVRVPPIVDTLRLRPCRVISSTWAWPRYHSLVPNAAGIPSSEGNRPCSAVPLHSCCWSAQPRAPLKLNCRNRCRPTEAQGLRPQHPRHLSSLQARRRPNPQRLSAKAARRRAACSESAYAEPSHRTKKRRITPAGRSPRLAKNAKGASRSKNLSVQLAPAHAEIALARRAH